MLITNDCRKNSSKFCQNNGNCTHPAMRLANSTWMIKELYYYLDVEFKCECLPGFGGEYCQYDINECYSSNFFDLKLKIDKIFFKYFENLFLDPCQNNGLCINLVNDFQCSCALGYSGKNCEININECENNK